MTIFSDKIDFFLIKFPAIFPLIYLSALFAFPEYGSVIAFIALITLAEPHFGATWSVFFDIKMREFAKQNKFLFIYLPVLIVIVVTFLFFKLPSLFYFLFFAFNIYHVTRQSSGICKLYSLTAAEKQYQEYSLYIINILAFFGVVAFHLAKIISQNEAIQFGYFLILVSLLVVLLQKLKFGSVERSLTTLAGLSMFLPAFFVSEPIHAILAGITMHYSQYLVLMFKITAGKATDVEKIGAPVFESFNVKSYLMLIIIYGIIAVALTTASSQGSETFSKLIFLPLLGQVLHFYFDGLIWKFKNKEMREIHLKFLFYDLKYTRS